jgi:hypothetical protein
MVDARKATTRIASLLRARRWRCAAGLSAILIAGAAVHAQTAAGTVAAPAQESAPPAQTTSVAAPAAAPSNAPENAPATTNAAQPGAQSNQAPTFTTPPVAIVPLDKSIPGAALAVEGSLQAWNGRAYLTGSGSISAGERTTEVTLPYRGALRVCASSTVKLAEDANAPAGEVPGLLIALDRGAVEMSFAASAAREKNADTLLTPYFRILIGGPNAADVKVRLGEHGDTCVDNAGTDAPYVVVSSVFEGGLYRVQAGQRVMFEHGSLQSVVDQESEPCGCPPPPAATRGNEFPLAQSEGLVPPASQTPVAADHPMSGAGATDTFAYNGAEHTAQTAGPVVAAPVASAAPAPPAPAPTPAKKPGFFARVGQFFKKIFGAE